MSILRSKIARYIIRKLRLPNDEENVTATIDNIRSGAELSGAYLWVLAAAIFIASLGLNTNSTAVIIGAMLISPLMGPIIGFGLGLGINDVKLVKRSARNFLMMVLLSVFTSTVYFFITPVKEAGSELLGRTAPTLYDVLIAFFGGIAGIIAGASRLRTSNVIPGVAIATALMPPLCTIGYGLSNFNWHYALGAFYLFMINSVFISIATYLVVNLLGYPKVRETGRRRYITWLLSLLAILVIAPSIYLTYHIVKKYFYRQNAESFVRNEIQSPQHIVVTSKFDYSPGNSLLELVMMGDVIDSAQTELLKEKMKKYGLYNCGLQLYQGPDSRAAAKGMFDQLSSDMAVQSLSIKDIYLRMDSLQRELAKTVLPDSLQPTVAREIKQLDSTLNRLSINRTFSFNPSRNMNDTLWQVTASFSGEVPLLRRLALEVWLRERLQSANVSLLLE